MKTKRTIKILVAVLLLLLATVAGTGSYLLRMAHRWVEREALKMLSEELGTRVVADSVGLWLHKGEAVLYGFEMDDRKGVRMLRVDTLEAQVNMSGLFSKHIVVEGVKLSGATAVLYKERKDTAANYQFFIDTFRKKRTPRKRDDKWIDLNLNFADFRNLNLKWDVYSARLKGGDTLDVNHLQLADMGMQLRGRMMVENSLDVRLRNIQANEMKSRIRFTLDKGTMRTIRRRNTNLDLHGLRANYLGRRVSFDRMNIFQKGDVLSLDRTMSLKIDSLRYFSDNGKPRKNHNRPHRGAFDPGHLDVVMNMEATLHTFDRDSMQGNITHLWAYDKGSGLLVKDMSTFFAMTRYEANLVKTRINLEHTSINIDKVQVKGKCIRPFHLSADVLLKDIAQPFAPVLSNFTTPLKLNVDVAGTPERITFSNILIQTPDRRLRLTAQGDLCDVLKKELLCLHFNNINMDARSGVKEEIVAHFAKKVKMKMQKQMKAVGDVHFTGRLGIFHKRQEIAGMLYTKHGNVTVDFTLDGNTHYMTGSLDAGPLEIGSIMNVAGVGIDGAKALYSFDIASKRRKAAGQHTGGRLPQGWLRATVKGPRYKKLHFSVANVDIDSDGSVAKGRILVPQSFLDILVDFKYIQTDKVQKMKFKPRLKRHKK